MTPERRVTAFAPASVGNVAVGFDILGHALAAPGDRVTARRIAEPGVAIEAITGCVTDLPREAERNAASAAVLALSKSLGLRHGFRLAIDKGIPIGSGMGGSAASAVAALVAANALLDEPLPLPALMPFTLDGEAAASGSRHGDNAAASLLGGLVLSGGGEPIRIAVPDGLHCALVHPHALLETRTARAVLAGGFALPDIVGQTGRLARLLLACERRDAPLLTGALEDVLIEPRRAALVPAFADVKRAALDSGAIGASISGAGPSVFAWCLGEAVTERVATAMAAAFDAAGIASDRFVSPVDAPGARVLP